MKDRYYALRGWDRETGIPTRETLERCGLQDVADALERLIGSLASATEETGMPVAAG